MKTDSLFELDIKKLFGVHNYKIKVPRDRRVTFLTGPNGWGKTTILDLIWGISARWPGYMPPAFAEIRYRDADNDLKITRESHKLSFNGEPEGVWDKGDAPATAFHISLLRCNADRESTEEAIDEFNDSIDEDLELPANRARKKLFLALLNRYLGDKKWLSGPHASGHDFRLKGTKTEIDLSDLSAGEQLLVFIWYYALFLVKRGDLYMIDMPETCMHMEWQMGFHRDLIACMDLVDAHALVATHSPQIFNSCWSETIDLYELEHPNKKSEVIRNA